PRLSDSLTVFVSPCFRCVASVGAWIVNVASLSPVSVVDVVAVDEPVMDVVAVDEPVMDVVACVAAVPRCVAPPGGLVLHPAMAAAAKTVMPTERSLI